LLFVSALFALIAAFDGHFVLLSHSDAGVICWRVVVLNEEDKVKKAIIVSLSGLLLLAGCQNQADKSAGIPVGPKWKGAPYRLTIDAQAAKPSPKGITLPAIKFNANPDALETRVVLIVRFEAPGATVNGPAMNRMIGAPVDIKGADSALPADYLESSSKGLSDFLAAYCVQGKVNLTVALARSSLNPHPTDAEVDAKRLSDWTPIEATFKNPNTKCKAAK
jgi:uncharacterized lipoprotein NlpE involved in copper resistance